MTQNLQRREHCKLQNHTYNVGHKRTPLSHRENMMNLHGISGGPPRKMYQRISKIQSVKGVGGEERKELKKKQERGRKL